MNLAWKNRFLESRDAVIIQFKELAVILEEFSHQMEKAVDIPQDTADAVEKEFKRRHIIIEKMLILEYENHQKEAFLTMRTGNGRCVTAKEAAELLEEAMDENEWCVAHDGRNLITKQPATIRFVEKGRYRMSEDCSLSRANQGHSIPVDVELKETKPPKVLYHGTAERFLPSIMAQGLKSMSRLYVHLSGDYETAVKVGKRHGKPVVLSVDTERMMRDGAVFYRSENGVWLTGPVESKYLEIMDRE